jgi:hypothetical protein
VIESGFPIPTTREPTTGSRHDGKIVSSDGRFEVRNAPGRLSFGVIEGTVETAGLEFNALRDSPEPADDASREYVER